jgi:transposase
MQKALTSMNIQLANAISDVSGVTGLAIIRAILRGQRDPKELAKLRDRRIQASEEEVAQSLVGHWREDTLFELGQVVECYDFYRKQMACMRSAVGKVPGSIARSSSGPRSETGDSLGAGIGEEEAMQVQVAAKEPAHL